MRNYTLETERVIIPHYAGYPNSKVKITLESNDKRVLDWFDEHLEEFINAAQANFKD